MNDQEKAKAQERAAAYREMMASWAWKDYSALKADMRQSALERAIIAGKLEDVQVARGAVQALDGLDSEVNFILEGPK